MNKKETINIIIGDFFKLPDYKKLCREDIIQFAVNKTLELSKPKKDNKKIFFSESLIYNKRQFATQFITWPKSKMEYYWNAADTWSEEGNKKINWVKTIQSWDRRDIALGKLKFADEAKPKEEQLNFFANR